MEIKTIVNYLGLKISILVGRLWKKNSIESFVELFCNETLSRVYRLIIFSSDLKQNNIFLNEVKKAIDREAIKRKFDCFQPVKQTRESVFDVLYCDRRIIFLDD